MDRRTILAAVGSTSSVTLLGCLDGERDPDGENDSDGIDEPFDLFVYNYRDGPVRIAVDAVADGETIVSETVELAAPETVSTSETIGVVPAGTRELAVDARVVNEGVAASETFDLPLADPISGVEIRAETDGRLRIAVMGYEQPAEP
ncbi:hypothetical protein [Halorubrum sp. DTA98]|uniref:hypothetical protein n=1 Tax=Halorubrum sp. DTA98 TaxID=3402163 RepID=UPI003AAA4EF8